MYGNRKIQRAKPKPFSRPSIELAAPAVKREWQTIAAEDVNVGDTIPDFGLVANISHTVSGEGTMVRLVSGHGRELVVPEDDCLQAFHRVG